MLPMAAATPDLALGLPRRQGRPMVGGYSGEEWSTLRKRGREIVHRARDPEVCLRLMWEKVGEFFNSAARRANLEGAWMGRSPR